MKNRIAAAVIVIVSLVAPIAHGEDKTADVTDMQLAGRQLLFATQNEQLTDALIAILGGVPDVRVGFDHA